MKLTVAGLSVTPLKGSRLNSPSEVLLGTEGVAENRRFYLVDDAGRLVNARQSGALTQVWAEADAAGTRLSLKLPGRSRVIEQEAIPAEVVETDFWGRNVRGRVCPGPWEDPLSALCRRHVRVVRAERAGEVCDRQPVTLLSQGSLKELADHAGNPKAGDEQRFRMLVTLAGCGAREEDSWGGRQLRLGEALLRIGGPVPRCVVRTIHPTAAAGIWIHSARSEACAVAERAARSISGFTRKSRSPDGSASATRRSSSPPDYSAGVRYCPCI